MTPSDDMLDHSAFLDDVAAYALGVLPPKEAESVVIHLKRCDPCQKEYALLSSTATALASAAETTNGNAPSPLLKARIMKEVRAEKRRKWQLSVFPAYLAAAACLVFAAVVGFSDFRLRSDLAQERARGIEQRQTIADFIAGSSKRYAFENGEVLTRDGRVYLAMHDLAALPPGRVYQAWTVGKGAKMPTPSLTFAPSSGGTALVELPIAAPAIVAVAVSVEPSGGSRLPTTKPIVVVKVGV